LENERDWYKKEAIHLDKVLEQTKAQNKELKEKLDESEADRKWMKEELEKVSSIVRASEILPLA
jgi:predicted RNase H-like nuclease (RuvC/YqgF family)